MWRKLSENKWGAAALALREGRPTCWAAYAKHRLCLASRTCAFLLFSHTLNLAGLRLFSDTQQRVFSCLLRAAHGFAQ